MKYQISSAVTPAVQENAPFDKASIRYTAPSVRTRIQYTTSLTNEVSSDLVCEAAVCSREKRDKSRFCIDRKAPRNKEFHEMFLLTAQIPVPYGTAPKVVGWTSIVLTVGASPKRKRM